VKGTKSLFDIYQRCNVIVLEPIDYEDAARDANWVAEMEAEIKMIEKNKTWCLVDKSSNKKTIGVKWVFKIKYNVDSSINRYKT